MKQIGYVFLGWLLGVLSMLITKWLQAREDRHNKEIDIISEVLTYLFKIRQTFNNFLTDRLLLEKVQKEFPEKAREIEKKMYARFDDELSRDFFPRLMFHSFQLKRLEDKTFWKDFESLMDKCEELGKTIMDTTGFEKITKLNEDILGLMKNFVEKCLAKAKV